MSYKRWFDAHALKHRAIMKKLTHLSEGEVIAYFRFENMVVNEPDFCPLYARHTRCHDIDELNCYLCACPHFRFSDRGFRTEGERSLLSFCSIDSPEGERFLTESAIHQNCSGCLIPHRERYLTQVFDREWLSVMDAVVCDKPF